MAFEENLTDIWYGNEIEVSIGYWDAGTSSWVYEVVEYREGFSPDRPDDKEGVYDGLEYVGDKRVQVEKSIDLSQRFEGFGVGLDKFENTGGLIIKATIVPDGGSLPADVDASRWYTNFTTSPSTLDDVPNQGEFNVNLSGRFDERVNSESTGSESWVIDHSGTF